MSNIDDTKELLDKTLQAKQEVVLIKEKLNSLNEEKEKWFSKKNEFANLIKNNIDSVKDLKKKRNELTFKVKSLKKDRDVMNSEISENVKIIVKEKKDIAPLPEVKGKRIVPGKVRAEIEAIDFKLQTEPMSFDKEQRFRKRIKELEKQLDGLKEILSSSKELREVTTKTSSLKKKANVVHKEIQGLAKESQDIHEQLILKSKEIDSFKEKEEEAYNKFLELKNEFNKLNTELQEKHKSFFEAKQRRDEVKTVSMKKKKADDAKVMKEKTREVEEKISKRKKLTTEDLLVLQRSQD